MCMVGELKNERGGGELKNGRGGVVRILGVVIGMGMIRRE
jgi:hypothetical protein